MNYVIKEVGSKIMIGFLHTSIITNFINKKKAEVKD